jgi:hypothetical protein
MPYVVDDAEIQFLNPSARPLGWTKADDGSNPEDLEKTSQALKL